MTFFQQTPLENCFKEGVRAGYEVLSCHTFPSSVWISWRFEYMVN